jgi:retron-type reverse transcriptase
LVARCSENISWSRVRLDTTATKRESWKTLPWKKFRRDLFRLQKRVFKAIQVGDKPKAKSLQKLILKSRAARMLAIRQVTQQNAGKKTAEIDKKASLTFEKRFALSEELRAKSNNWKHQKLRSIPIPKKDGNTRLLKIPTIADRAWQCLAKYVLEPACALQLFTPVVMGLEQEGRRMTRRNFCSRIYALRVME